MNQLDYLGILINLNLDWKNHWESQKGCALKQVEYLKRRRLTINQKISVINAQMVSKSCRKEIKRMGKNAEERKMNGVNHA